MDMKINKLFYIALITFFFISAIKKIINLSHFQFNQLESLAYNSGEITGKTLAIIACLGFIKLFYNRI